MVLTAKEKKMLIRILKKEKCRIFLKEKRRDVNQLLEKLEQSSRNEKVNEVKPSKL